MNPVGAFRFQVFFVDPPAQGTDSPAAGLGQLTPASVGATTLVRFAEVQGIDAGIEIETYHEGGRNTNPLRFARWGRFSNLTFRRGITTNDALWKWYFDVQFGTAKPPRKNGFVLLQSPGAQTALPGIGTQPVAAWFFANALPERLSGPSLDAKTNQIAVESLEITHEGLLRLSPTFIPGLSQVAGD